MYNPSADDLFDLETETSPTSGYQYADLVEVPTQNQYETLNNYQYDYTAASYHSVNYVDNHLQFENDGEYNCLDSNYSAYDAPHNNCQFLDDNGNSIPLSVNPVEQFIEVNDMDNLVLNQSGNHEDSSTHYVPDRENLTEDISAYFVVQPKQKESVNKDHDLAHHSVNHVDNHLQFENSDDYNSRGTNYNTHDAPHNNCQFVDENGHSVAFSVIPVEQFIDVNNMPELIPNQDNLCNRSHENTSAHYAPNRENLTEDISAYFVVQPKQKGIISNDHLAHHSVTRDRKKLFNIASILAHQNVESSIDNMPSFAHRLANNGQKRKINKGSSRANDSLQLPNRICKICEDNASGYHYGVMSCEGCKAFFRRKIHQKGSLSCKWSMNCIMNRESRSHCQYCRLKKCIAAGMKADGVGREIVTKAIKGPVVEEDQVIVSIIDELYRENLEKKQKTETVSKSVNGAGPSSVASYETGTSSVSSYEAGASSVNSYGTGTSPVSFYGTETSYVSPYESGPSSVSCYGTGPSSVASSGAGPSSVSSSSSVPVAYEQENFYINYEVDQF